MALNKPGRKLKPKKEKAVSVGGYIALKHKPKAKKAIDQLLSDIPLMIAYADGNAVIVEAAKL